MIKGDKIINDLVYGDAVHMLAKNRNIDLTEARTEMAKLSFNDYCKLEEASADIAPPSGNTISPTAGTPQKSTSQPQGSQTGSKSMNMWAGKGSPAEMGMTVGIKGPSGSQIPGEITKVDQSTNRVTVKDPATGQEQIVNTDVLEPFQDRRSAGQPPAQTPLTNKPGQGGFALDQMGQMEESKDLARMRKLAGIVENSSAGATGAGSIAVSPTAMAGPKRRQGATEQKKEYTRTAPAKTIVGDTKSHQASGELSATLAANGKKTASRINNGRKKF